MKLSIVIPAYNESENIPVIISKLKDSIQVVGQIDDYEILICDDHSSDGTYEVTAAMNDKRIKCIRLSKRSGSHVALRAGLRHAQGDMALCISADGQDDPGMLKLMVDKIIQGKHIVWGVRNKRNEKFINKYFAIFFYKLLSLFVSNQNKVDLANADFYLLSRKVIDTINQFEERNTSLFGLIAWIGFEQDQVLYERKQRYSGKSKWGFGSKLKLAADWIIAFSGLPLKLIAILGFMFAVLGFGYAIYILIFALSGNAIPGWASTTTLILLIGGIQLMMIGVLGEYLWRTLEESRKRPVYFIEKTNNIN
jgi:dolichol-phosphate mannosyltransferase